ncbi:SDR family NAD(P)-dependent oxidoreductase [Mycolicibacterium iranicum]|uniref:Short-chain dehydrogenase n=1 Tax=Mycolicibacterium iranicum TaxID=912594 RepID=A0A178LN78_MYCIR|nr:SDR family NAD(P)-dependent oxidoreductase [Mycolicibacterium iranicum]OAN32629.1 short-chain dehydrogenase [Mycolicibacterium iranicum]
MTNWTTSDIPDQTGRTAVITGANTGLGFETAKALAATGATVVIAARNIDKGQDAVRRIRQEAPQATVALQQLDLSSLDSVRAAADQLKCDHATIDLLVNNAGVMYTPRQETADGFELQFGTNHLGHFALTGLLLDQIEAAPAGRIVTVSSIGHRIRADIHFDDLQLARNYNRVVAYGQSKLANLLFTYELQRRLSAAGSSTAALAAHPGGSNTELGRHLPLLDPVFRAVSQSASMGALPTLRAATDPAARGGQYYGPSGPFELRGYPQVVSSSKRSHDAALQRRLWTVSEELTKVVYSV